jgi:hypothetical protein
MSPSPFLIAHAKTCGAPRTTRSRRVRAAAAFEPRIVR